MKTSRQLTGGGVKMGKPVVIRPVASLKVKAATKKAVWLMAAKCP
jgi:hypothetical protein